MADARERYREGFAHFVEGRVEEAIERYREALAEEPDFALAWAALARALAARDRLDEAVEAARRVVELEPDDPLGHTHLSILYQRQGRIAEAEEEKAVAARLTAAAERRS